MMKRILAVFAILCMTVFTASSIAGVDNTLDGGARKVEGGIKAAGRSAEEIGGKAWKAVAGAAGDSRRALGSAWDNIVQGVRKAFK